MFNKRGAMFFYAMLLSFFVWGGGELDDYVHPGSQSLRKISLNNGYELAYGLKAEYPAEGVLEWYERILSNDGYVRCGSPVPEWQNYSDRANGRSAMKFDRNAVWVNKSQGHLAFLVLGYISQNGPKPDNSDLSISLQVLKLQSNEELSAALNSLEIGGCP